MMSTNDPCQRQACDIQKCLQANNYKEARCEDVIHAMLMCCIKHGNKKSVCCSGFLDEWKPKLPVELAEDERMFTKLLFFKLPKKQMPFSSLKKIDAKIKNRFASPPSDPP